MEFLNCRVNKYFDYNILGLETVHFQMSSKYPAYVTYI